MARTISHEWAQRTSEILLLPREHKIHIFSPPCNILYLFLPFSLTSRSSLLKRPTHWRLQFSVERLRNSVSNITFHSGVDAVMPKTFFINNAPMIASHYKNPISLCGLGLFFLPTTCNDSSCILKQWIVFFAISSVIHPRATPTCPFNSALSTSPCISFLPNQPRLETSSMRCMHGNWSPRDRCHLWHGHKDSYLVGCSESCYFTLHTNKRNLYVVKSVPTL